MIQCYDLDNTQYRIMQDNLSEYRQAMKLKQKMISKSPSTELSFLGKQIAAYSIHLLRRFKYL